MSIDTEEKISSAVIQATLAEYKANSVPKGGARSRSANEIIAEEGAYVRGYVRGYIRRSMQFALKAFEDFYNRTSTYSEIESLLKKFDIPEDIIKAAYNYRDDSIFDRYPDSYPKDIEEEVFISIYDIPAYLGLLLEE